MKEAIEDVERKMMILRKDARFIPDDSHAFDDAIAIFLPLGTLDL